MQTITLNVNGEARTTEVDPSQSLLEVLRENLGITSLKDGCSGQGQCGCCVVLIDGKPRKTCTLKATIIKDREIVTLEGVSDAERQLYADAFQSAAGLQCGFCTPGFVVRIKALTDDTAELSRTEIAEALEGHLCRCTGYTKIIEAIALAAERRSAP
jgi:xanthine dehydrogenase molybdenum-binding subunit